MGKTTILLAASEALPFVKTGGLADVMGALPKALASRGAAVKVVVPYYPETPSAGIRTYKIISGLEVKVGSARKRATIYKGFVDDAYEVYLIRHDPSFNRPAIYGEKGSDYPDNAQRFALFSRAVVELLERTEERVDVVHAHDWQTALVPLLLAERRSSGAPDNPATVFTIHNIGYQGIFPKDVLPEIGLSWDYFHPEGIEFYDQVNFLKAGIVWSDAVTTVSPRYGIEIQDPKHGFGLDGLLRKHAYKLQGVLNGADYTRWNPSTDPVISARYSSEDLSGKASCRRDLLARFGLPVDSPHPVLGMTTRLAYQKGIDMLLGALPELAGMDIHLVVLGSGYPEYQQALEEAATRYPNVRAAVGFNEETAHRIIAGSDIFLMPSRYEPCGLSQMYSLKYGTVPVVRATGGLMDTVDRYDPITGEGTGFLFHEESSAGILAAIRDALAAWARPAIWRRIMTNGMARDFSWERSAGSYLDLYREVISSRTSTDMEVLS